ncbi:UDP-phosphate alpha N-acetylglucosaminyltransferase [Methylobacterium sp. 17Sr1-1]|uniref:UDP-phosphate alpha N-acetylglucosaminyltransferase n=1 Tax=Methylobacterium sp. 17Sr1-1 TaxID=2202826 RepID=UPI0013A5BBE8|nr:UDP-phosphate alpha N-acetylglucosaminyltransferase [Methylobacterium sp. 17Sr1-1]
MTSGMTAGLHPAASPAADWRAPFQGRVASVVLVGALVFNAALCFLNTAGVPVTGGTVMGAEVAIIAVTLGFALDERPGPWLVLAGLVTYGLLLVTLRGNADVKGIRDFLIPVVFYCLGTRSPSLRDADRAVLASGVIVVVMGVFEYGLFDVYQQYFNIVRYYVARGSMSAAEISELTGSLFTSGIRPDSRAILPFLGPHRVSSVFLEPVSAGNFGAVLFAWALYRRTMRGRTWLFLCAAVTIILADARFGAYVCVAIAGAMLVGYRLPRLLWFALPFTILLALAVYGFESVQTSWQNDMAGRLLWAALLITSLPPEGVWGIMPDKMFLSDSGYAYTLTQLGVAGALVAWGLFVLMPARNPDGWRLRCAMAIYLCLLLVISDSPYSIKTAALAWFMMGAADGVEPETGRLAEA